MTRSGRDPSQPRPNGRSGSSIRRRRATTAFTLIELLVVIAIIALLIGILLPTLKAVRDRAKDAKCLSNQRQILVAVGAYTADNQGFYPFTDAKQLEALYQQAGRRQGDWLNSYVGSPRGFASVIEDYAGDVIRYGLDFDDGEPVFVTDPFTGREMQNRVAIKTDIFGCPRLRGAGTGISEDGFTDDRSALFSYRYTDPFFRPTAYYRTVLLEGFNLTDTPHAPQRVSRVRYPSLKVMLGDSRTNHQETGVGNPWNVTDTVGIFNFSFPDGHVETVRNDEMLPSLNITYGKPVPDPNYTPDGIEGRDLGAPLNRDIFEGIPGF